MPQVLRFALHGQYNNEKNYLSKKKKKRFAPHGAFLSIFLPIKGGSIASEELGNISRCTKLIPHYTW